MNPISVSASAWTRSNQDQSCRRGISRAASLFFGLALILLSLSAMAAEQSAPIQSASEYEYPPFSVVTPDGRADGFSVELMRAALHAMGREVEFKVGPWHEIKQALAEGRIQALPLVARTLERDKFYDFTSP